MSDEWDLYAVVKSCTAATATAATESTQEEDPFTKFSSLSSQNYDNLFSFPDFQENRKYQGLEEIYREFYVQPHGITTSQIFNENLQPPPLQEFNNSLVDSSIFSALNSQTKSSNKRRKNEQIVKMVHQMTQEELSADSWAWRKYGQKPIKGSPYPRNYYRCSSSKGCSARKQVEQSPNDSTIFIVSYTGEHTHPRPTHRSSLSGSSRTHKTPPPPAAAVPQNPSSPASSPASASTYYSIEGEIVKLGELDDEDEDVLIPNTFMTEEIFGGFDEINGGKNRGRCSVNLGSDSDSKIGEFSGGKFSNSSATPTAAALDGVF